MRRLEPFPQKREKSACKPKPYPQMTYPGQRIQADVKLVSRRCAADPELRLYQYTAIDRLTRPRFLAACPEQSAFPSAVFLKKPFKWYIRVGCVQTDNIFEFPNRFSNSRRDLPTLYETTHAVLPFFGSARHPTCQSGIARSDKWGAFSFPAVRLNSVGQSLRPQTNQSLCGIDSLTEVPP